ncbi:HNH endonuclease domain-containing protein [Alkalicoccus luteus]|uniref:HNH endonuclease domain-containing protein n=1 Tax=Alkalicoccus luteus TaxID=1237094 RepID=UPI0040342EB3
MYYKLREGELKHAYITDEEIWRIFSRVMSTKSTKSSTYKFVLFKSLIENLYNVNDQLEVNYDQLAYSFAKMFWNMVVGNGITQHNTGANAKAATIILDYQAAHATPSGWKFDKVPDANQVEIVHKVKQAMKTNVFGALFGDTEETFYEFSHQHEKLRFHPNVYTFLLKYQLLLVQLTNFHLARMIEKLNGTASGLLLKVEDLSKRENLKPFEKILLHYMDASCFYCGKDVSTGKRSTHVDHFIPWSFVQSDQVWNLVLSCQTCNSSKSDKLAKPYYLDKLLDRNEALQGQAEIADFDVYAPAKLRQMYQYSIKNGYNDIWVPPAT